MKILVASATRFEVDPVRQLCSQTAGSDPRWARVEFLTTGVGMTNTALQLAVALQQQQYDLVIQAGVAGCFDHELTLASVFVVKDEVFGDLGVEENGAWKDLFDLNLDNADNLPFVQGRIPALWPGVAYRPPFDTLSAVTVNEITTRHERISQLKNRYNPQLESMEGAALHLVGHHFKIPFIQLRAVSNYVGERNKENWRLREAIANLNEGLYSYLKKIIEQ